MLLQKCTTSYLITEDKQKQQTITTNNNTINGSHLCENRKYSKDIIRDINILHNTF